MKNGQLKPGYNVQISTSNQYIVNSPILQIPRRSWHIWHSIKPVSAKPQKWLPQMRGYGSEENYTLLEEKEVTAFVKYGMFDKEQDENHNSKFPFVSDKLFYNQEKGCYICPIGQQMDFIGNYTRKTSTGFEQKVKRYQAKNCATCPLNGACHKSEGNRIIEINGNLKRQKQKTYELVNTEQGIERRKKRCFDVEPVFGNIKQNHGFRRFMLRGKEKVTIEWGLLAIAQNLRKKAA